MKKRHEFFPMYLHSGASYAPENGGVWKKGHPRCRVRKFSILTQKLFFWQAFKNRHQFAGPTVKGCQQQQEYMPQFGYKHPAGTPAIAAGTHN
jgi:hypothetical protein